MHVIGRETRRGRGPRLPAPGSRPDSTQGERPGARGAFRATCTSGVEAFSNGVFVVAITVLALEMSTPAHPGGGLLPPCCSNGLPTWAI